MDEKLDDNYLNDGRSEEVDDIVNRVPSRIVRWGTVLISLIFLIFLSISWFIKYPDVLRAEVMITTTPSPVNLVSRADGRLRLLKTDREFVRTGDVIALIDGIVDLEDLQNLEVLI